MKPRFSTGDLVRPLPGQYEGYSAGSKYNLARGTAIVVESNYGYIKVATADGVSPALSPDSFEFANVSRIEGPIRTVTRTEIVPGMYGAVCVGGQYVIPDCEKPNMPSTRSVGIKLYNDHFTSAELTAAIATLTAVRDALDEVA